MRIPDIAVLIPTYNRPDVLAHTVQLLQRHLIYDGTIRYYIGNDSDTPQDVPHAVNLIGPRNGLGANLNMLLSFTSEAFILQMDDDHWLLKPLDLNPHVKKLHTDANAGWVRLMGIGAHKYIGRLDESYWRVSWESPELYIPSNRPHLKHRRFHQCYGLYPEGYKLGETEDNFCHQCKDHWRKHGGPDVLVPLDVATESSWDHVGDSWQLRGL